MAKTYSELLNGANTIKNETVAGANTATRVGTELVDIVEKIQQVDTDGLDLGTTPESAFRGDYGQEAYQHANTTGNPHGTAASEIGNTPSGDLSATTVQGAINELDSEKVGKTTKINGYSLNDDINLSKSDVGLSNVDNTSDVNKPISEATQNALSLKADLVGGKIPSTQLPAYVDDVLEYANFAAFPATGESGKIYVALNTNLTYRWSGTAYVEISKSLALGETSDTAYRGDRGKTAYDHSQTTGNPHGTTATQVANTPSGSVSATTVQGAINELAGDIVQVETDLNKNGLIATYLHSVNLEIHVTSIDIITGSFSKSGHGLINGDRISPILNSGSVELAAISVFPYTMGNDTYYVVEATQDSFKIATSVGGVPITFSSNPTMNLSKWHFEKINNANILFTGIQSLTAIKIDVNIRSLNQSQFYVYSNGVFFENNAFIKASEVTPVDVAPAYPVISIPKAYWGFISLKYFSSQIKQYEVYGNVVSYSTSPSRMKITNVNRYASLNSIGGPITSIAIRDHYFANGTIINIYKI